MAATLDATPYISGILTVQGVTTPSLSYIGAKSANLILTTTLGNLFNGSVGLGVTPTTQQLDLSTDFARKLTTSTWFTGSDKRIKTNIQTANLVRCAEILDSIDLKYFEWKTAAGDQHSLGWIAQDVQKVFPKSVVPDANGILMLNSDQLIKVLYGALKQTQLEFFHS